MKLVTHSKKNKKDDCYFFLYLFLCAFRSCQYYIVSFVVIHHTHRTNAQLISSTVHIHIFVMMRTDLLLQVEVPRGFDQLVFLQGRRFVVCLKVIVAVRCQTYQTRLHSLLLDTCTEITGYITWHAIATNLRVARKFQFLRLVHHVCQYGTSVQNGPGAECLCALGTAEDLQMIIFVPIIINASNAVVVATWDGHWIFQHIQADRTAKLFCITESFHFVVLCCREMFEMRKQRSSSQFCTDEPHLSILPIQMTDR